MERIRKEQCSIHHGIDVLYSSWYHDNRKVGKGKRSVCHWTWREYIISTQWNMHRVRFNMYVWMKKRKKKICRAYRNVGMWYVWTMCCRVHLEIRVDKMSFFELCFSSVWWIFQWMFMQTDLFYIWCESIAQRWRFWECSDSRENLYSSYFVSPKILASVRGKISICGWHRVKKINLTWAATKNFFAKICRKTDKIM